MEIRNTNPCVPTLSQKIEDPIVDFDQLDKEIDEAADIKKLSDISARCYQTAVKCESIIKEKIQKELNENKDEVWGEIVVSEVGGEGEWIDGEGSGEKLNALPSIQMQCTHLQKKIT